MDTYTIIGIAASVCAAALGVGLGLGLLSFRRKNVALIQSGISVRGVEGVKEAVAARRRLSRPSGARRTTSIHGVNSAGYLRHTDGSYTKAYHLRMPATLYAEGETVERCYNDWARTLQSIKQHGCVVQLRHDVWPDGGRAVASHIRAQAQAQDTYIPARMLHTVGLTGTEAAARAGQYQDDRLTLWVRVPVRHANDPSRARLSLIAGFFPALAKEIRKQGVAGMLRAAAAAWTSTSVEALCSRSRLDEEAACEAAGQVFAAVEHMCPLELRPFTREEMWGEVYRSHRLNERAAPALPLVEGADLRQQLCGEEVTAGGHFVMHGDRPVAVISLFRPPTPVISAGMLRVMTANPNLVFRHTTVVEYLTLDQERAKTHLRNQSKDLSRAQTAVGRKSPTPGDDDPEALAAQQDIRRLREEMAGGRAREPDRGARLRRGLRRARAHPRGAVRERQEARRVLPPRRLGFGPHTRRGRRPRDPGGAARALPAGNRGRGERGAHRAGVHRDDALARPPRPVRERVARLAPPRHARDHALESPHRLRPVRRGRSALAPRPAARRLARRQERTALRDHHERARHS